MQIRQATAAEMLALWGEGTSTGAFFADNIMNGNAEFWAWDMDGALIGELYVFHALEDHDFANGRDTAYLCAFRMREDLRGQGYGTKLLSHVIGHLRADGWKFLTIGVDETETANLRLYRRMGFTESIKFSRIDPCDRDKNMQPCPAIGFTLLKKIL